MPSPRDPDESRNITFNNLIAGFTWVFYYLIAFGIAFLIIHFGGFSGTVGAHRTYVVFALIGAIVLVWGVIDVVRVLRLK